MRLISLELENFRQHKDTRINFSDGITIINGANGCGKSTILEAITWAIYGTEAARGNKDTIKWNRAPARSKVRVELVFAIDNETYKVIRWLDKAEVYLDANPAPIVTTQQEVTKYIINKLGMTREEFFNTYFTGQKELNFLGNQKPAERRKFISKVLGYEKIREAQEKARIDKNSVTNEIAGIKQGLGDIELIESEKKQIEERLAFVNQSLEAKKLEHTKLKAQLGELLPGWSKIKSSKEDYSRFSTELKFTLDKIHDYDRNIENLKNENVALEIKLKRLEYLQKHLEEYKQTEAKIQEQEKLQTHENERQKLLVQLESINKETTQHESKIKEIESLIETNKTIPAKVEALKAETDKLKLTIQEETRIWTSLKQEVKTLIIQKNKEFDKITAQHLLIEQNGEDGSCPTCQRTLKGEFEKVVSVFKEQKEALSQEICDLYNQDEILKEEPDLINISRKSLEEKEKEHQELSKIQTQLEEKAKFLATVKSDLEINKANKIKIEEAKAKLPEGFDRELLDKLRIEFADLKKVYDEVLGLKAQAVNHEKVKAALNDALKNKQEAQAKITEIQTKLSQINYSEDDYNRLEEFIQNTEKAANEAQYEVVKVEGELREVNAVLNRILDSEKQHKEKQDLIKSRQEELNYLIELDRFYGSFLENLNNQARPELSEIASDYLSNLTEGRYSVLELNDKYEICLREDAESEIKPVISGGEEDIANLCIRIAISKMIAQRSGRSLSLLILDEVFGSLDENRRNKVVDLLYSLTNSFDQVILITHIDDIKDSIDNIIRVEYDEDLGYSVVTITDSFNPGKFQETEEDELLILN